MNTVSIRHWGSATIVAGALAAALALSGCGGAAQESTAAEASASTSESVAATSAAAPGESDITVAETLENAKDGEHAIEADNVEAAYANVAVNKTGENVAWCRSLRVHSNGLSLFPETSMCQKPLEVRRARPKFDFLSPVPMAPNIQSHVPLASVSSRSKVAVRSRRGAMPVSMCEPPCECA